MKSKKKALLYFIFVVYASVLFYIFFIQVVGADRSTYFVNADDHITPFKSTTDMIKNAKRSGIKSQATTVMLINILGNIALFVPLGMLLPLMSRYFRSWKKVTLFGILLSGSVEVTQFLLSIGVFDIDDIIYNAIGAFLGFCVLMVVQALFRNRRVQMA